MNSLDLWLEVFTVLEVSPAAQDAESCCCHLQSEVCGPCGSFNFTGYFVPLVSC